MIYINVQGLICHLDEEREKQFTVDFRWRLSSVCGQKEKRWTDLSVCLYGFVTDGVQGVGWW